ncbi:MAG TPA: hypothetical protein VII73_06915 [Caulobacteraceae bacterium]
MGPKYLRTGLLVVALAFSVVRCGTFSCAGSADSNRSAGACGAHTTFLR